MSSKSIKEQLTVQDNVIAHVQIKGDPDGRAQIYIDGRPVKGLIGYRIEHNSSDKRAPILTLQVYCTLEMDSGAIPLLPEPWSWSYGPKVPNFVDGHQCPLKSFSGSMWPESNEYPNMDGDTVILDPQNFNSQDIYGQENGMDYLYGMVKKSESGGVEIFSMNGNTITIHGAQEAMFFIQRLIECLQ